MALFAKHKEILFGVGDKIRVTQNFEEGGKSRSTSFEGIVISIKKGENPSFIVRRIGEQRIGIERIFPLNLPTIEKIQVIKKGTSGVRHGKLYFIRSKSPKEIDKIYSRASKKNKVVEKIKNVRKKKAS